MRKRKITSRTADGAYVPFGNGRQKWILYAGVKALPVIYLGYCKDPRGVTFYYAQKKTDR